jgi:hypothetical protein
MLRNRFACLKIIPVAISVIKMTITRNTALEFWQSHRKSIRFSDNLVLELLHREQLLIGELCFVESKSGACVFQFMESMYSSCKSDSVVVEYQKTSENISSGLGGRNHVTSLDALVSQLESLVDTKPLVVFLLDRVNLLRGFRIAKLERLVTRLLDDGCVVVTNCWNLSSLAATRTVL